MKAGRVAVAAAVTLSAGCLTLTLVRRTLVLITVRGDSRYPDRRVSSRYYGSSEELLP